MFPWNTVIVGMRGTGKSHLASVLVEEAMAHNRRTKPAWQKVSVVVFAPSGNWWGIRAGKDGSPRGGCKVLIIGGEHADFPLDVTMGARIADLIDALGPVPILVQMDKLSPADQLTLVADFGERLCASTARRFLHLVFDEAESVYPSVPRRGESARCAAAVDRLVRKRRWHGIGATTVTSRPSNLHGGATSQTQRYFIFNMTWPKDVKVAAANALSGKGPEEKHEFCVDVAALQCGEAFHAAFGLEHGHTRFKVRPRRTFDSLQVSGFEAHGTPAVRLVSLPKRTLKIADRILFPQVKRTNGTADQKSKSAGRLTENEKISNGNERQDIAIRDSVPAV